MQELIRGKQLINFQKDKKKGKLREWHFDRNGFYRRENLTYKAHKHVIMAQFYCNIMLTEE